MKQLSLSELWIYPIKSLGGIPLQKAKVEQKGLQYDRRWMLVDENNVFLTQRIHSNMALFKLALQTDSIDVKFKGEHQLSIPLQANSASGNFEAKIWNDVVTVTEVDKDISRWFSKHLGMTCKLVSFPEDSSRPVDPHYAINHENVSLADAYPFLIIGQSSLNDLNKRLGQTMPMNRFRPNFVFTGGDAFEEDQWRNFRIGNNRFVGVKPCARCVLITVDQDTAEKGVEPLATLSTFRKRDNKVLFGQNLLAVDFGEVSVGERIILEL